MEWELGFMNIGAGGKYPSNALSNFAPHEFYMDGVRCASMEGWLQSLKFKGEMQEYVCTLTGKAAKFKGKRKPWWKTQTLHWKGVDYARDSAEYQDLLDRAYLALCGNAGFRRALLATRGYTLTHSIGKKKKNETILTEQEFCSRLTKLRARLLSGELTFDD